MRRRRDELDIMDLNLTLEARSKLNPIAERTHGGADELIEEAVGHLVNWKEWLEHKVGSRIAAADKGETTADDEVRRRLESRERP